MRQALIFSGTSDGSSLAVCLARRGWQVTVCTATAYGAKALPAIPGIRLRTGRMDAAQMEAFLKEYPFDTVVDATHPYAAAVSENIRRACQAGQVPCLRLLRRDQSCQGVVEVPDTAAAACFLNTVSGNVLLTTGSKELDAFAKPGLVERCYPRVLPMADSLDRCLKLGFPPKNIICMQGPFSKELNVALLKQYHIKTLVTKDTGGYGGFREKAEAAREAGCALLVVERPRAETGLTLEECKEKLLREGEA